MCGFRRVGALHLHAQVPERVSFLAAVYWRAYHYKQHINTAQAQTLAFFAPSHLDFPAYALFAPANSAMTISPGSTPIALPTQGMGGQYNAQLAFQNSQPYTANMLGQSIQSPSMQYTNTTQSSSSNLPWIFQIPGQAASTIGGLVNWAINPPGYTPGGAPLTEGANFTSS